MGAMNARPTLTIERTYAAPPERVFDAFTSEEVMRRWWHAGHDWETPEARVDLRIGGEVRVLMRDPHEDTEYGGGGVYTEIEPPSRLAFTWIWDDDRDQVEQLIVIDFEPSRRRDRRSASRTEPLERGGGPRPRGGLEHGLRQPGAGGP